MEKRKRMGKFSDYSTNRGQNRKLNGLYRIYLAKKFFSRLKNFSQENLQDIQERNKEKENMKDMET